MGDISFRKRLFDVVVAITIAIFLAVPFLAICFLVRVTSKGKALYWSKRVGRNNSIFLMPKFRTMKIDTPQLATHLLNDSKSYLTCIGPFLRKSSLDEVPQLWSIFKGDMSFVGPRPALYNQDDLIKLRSEKGIDKLRPGLTGWAQINGRDDIPIPEKVNLDFEYIQKRGIWMDLKIIWLTVFKVAGSKGVSH